MTRGDHIKQKLAAHIADAVSRALNGHTIQGRFEADEFYDHYLSGNIVREDEESLDKED